MCGRDALHDCKFASKRRLVMGKNPKIYFWSSVLTDLFPTSPLSLQRNKMAFASRLVLSLHSNSVLIFIDTTVLLPLV